ncbi:uncharacterized protein LOC110436663 [Sorghum bicolor]|nr:uncharacterized protein LOC110436663 [Sorghum bicolor]KXG27011.1 hypothetical protein SORBI_3006G196100 [Sorghum bicolor]|eukprot:XP_021319786.1 uncharacterized protein LOC110436663 [Sorghum bicolor]
MAARILCDWFISLYNHRVLAKFPCFATLVADVLFLRTDRVRASLDRKLVINKAVELVEAIAHKTPELKDRMHYPRVRNNLDNVVPVGSSFRQRRRAKSSGHKQSTDIAQFYLQLKKRLPSSNPVEKRLFSAMNKWEVLIALLDQALQAGRDDPVLKQGHPTGSLSKQVFPLKAFVTRGSLVFPQSNQGHESEHSSKLDTSQIPATVATPEINSAMKRSSHQESHKDTSDPNVSKRPRVTGTGSFVEVSPSVY